jgi:hypothetical protein
VVVVSRLLSLWMWVPWGLFFGWHARTVFVSPEAEATAPELSRDEVALVG